MDEPSVPQCYWSVQPEPRRPLQQLPGPAEAEMGETETILGMQTMLATVNQTRTTPIADGKGATRPLTMAALGVAVEMAAQGGGARLRPVNGRFPTV